MAIVEVLSPVGDLKNFYVAISAGADAVYLGLDKFNARMKAENISLDNLKQVVEFAHLKGVKVYVTLNTLVSGSEIPQVVTLVGQCLEMGVDAFIVQDFGIISVLKKVYDGIVLHGSTQLGVHNVRGAKVAKKLGLSRVVLSREVTLEDIVEIKNNVDIELEVFVQGAMCVGFSGNCYLSSLKFGASGNRGECKQLCRLPFTLSSKENSIQGYPLSTRDNCMVGRIRELIHLGVVSLKIEGRLRRKGYVNIATRIYRDLVDNITLEKNNKLSSNNSEKMQGYFHEDIHKNLEDNTNVFLQKNDTRFSTENNTKDTQNNINEIDNYVDISKMKDTLKKVFSRGDFIEGYFNGNNIIDTRFNNHVGEEIGKVVECTKFKDIYKIVIKCNCTLNKGDGLRIVNNNQNITLGVGNIEVSDKKYIIYNSNYVSSNSIVYRTSNEVFESQVVDKSKYRDLCIRITAFQNTAFTISMNSGKYTYEVKGSICELANNKPTTEEILKEQVSKLGDLKEIFKLKKIHLKMSNNIFLPIKEINGLRRECLEGLKNAILNDEKIIIKKSQFVKENFNQKSSLKSIAMVDETCKLLKLKSHYQALILSPTIFNKNIIKNFNEEYVKYFKHPLIVNLPIIALKDDLKIIDEIVEYCRVKGIILLANNIYAIDYIKNGCRVWAGSNMNITNEYSANLLASLGVEEMVGSIEKWANGVNGLYRMCKGNRVLMTFAHCPHKTLSQSDCLTSVCKYSGNLRLKGNKEDYFIRRYKIAKCYFELVDSLNEERVAEHTIDDLRGIIYV